MTEGANRGRVRVRRGALWLGRGGGAVLVSVLVHAAAAITIGGVLVRAARSGADEPRVDVDVVASTVAPEEVGPAAAPAAAPAARAVEARRRSGPRPATSLLVSAPVGLDETPPRFALSAGVVAASAVVSAPPQAAPAGSVVGAAAEGPETFDAAAVDVPARLLAQSPLVYPEAGRRAAIELDLPLDLVVDASGRVVSARAVGHAGFGFDEAALEAIRAYRFSPATRAGRAVAVRMRWTVEFRLR